ncbi:MAG TPA: DUF5946 family protein [Candidatus Binatia bacterium]|nr:DUF5946 family protein [Candidatus Binatia bacterium]
MEARGAAGRVETAVACVGCGGLVPAIDGPIHRYMTSAPGCWEVYTSLLGGGLPPSPASGLVVDAFAVTHPGTPGPQSTSSVWTHLITLCFVLERRWPVDQAVRLRRVAANSFSGWPWLTPPDSMGDVTAIDIARALDAGDGTLAVDLTRRWVDGAWAAWSRHHPVVGARTDWLTRRLG